MGCSVLWTLSEKFEHILRMLQILFSNLYGFCIVSEVKVAIRKPQTSLIYSGNLLRRIFRVLLNAQSKECVHAHHREVSHERRQTVFCFERSNACEFGLK